MIDAKAKDQDMFNAIKISVFLVTLLASNTLTFGLTVYDDFTQGAVNDSPGGANSNGMDWIAYGAACLTAGGSKYNKTTGPNTASNYSNIPNCDPAYDRIGRGALRLTDLGFNQVGSIISRGTFPTNEGIQITFTTYAYGGWGNSGADGIGFFLQDGAVPTTLPYTSVLNSRKNYNMGTAGGSLGYSCSNFKLTDFDGLTGGYLGLGMDEFGNFNNAFDNTATGTGPDRTPNTISLRGAGNVSWYWLSSRYPRLYPINASAWDSASMYRYDEAKMIYNTCKTGLLQKGVNGTLSYTTSALSWSGGVLTVTVAGASNIEFVVGDSINIASTSSSAPPLVNGTSIVGSYVVTAVSEKTFSFSYPGGAASYANAANGRVTVNVPDYPSIPDSVKTLPDETPLWTNVTSRDKAKPITYKLSISPNGFLDFLYSYNGGAYQPVLTKKPITASNGPLPASFRFGFLASTGDVVNIHEITCFIAQSRQSGSSAGANVIKSGQVRTGTQVYLASYDTTSWYGILVSDAVVNTNGVLSVSTASQWDANCILTGGACPSMGTSDGKAINTITAQPPNSREILTWNGSGGIPFRWSDLTSDQKTVLNSTDNAGAQRLDWLRGVRTQEQTNGGALRARDGVLGDIVDSSPVQIGSPTKNYQASFSDALTGVTGPETSYITFKNSLASRLNVVYVGSNDGMLHGFRAGSYNVDGTYNAETNDGYEVLGYVPGSVLSNSSVVGLTSTSYGHSYFVDAAPGFGDVYYNGAWHTWLVGGMGPGGAEIYALDVTDPTGMLRPALAFTETNASSLVIGDWTPASLTKATCVNAASACGNNLGKTYGTPLLRRLHNGQWAIIFGNGEGSINGHAGVYVGLINPSDGSVSFYWLDTGNGDPTNNPNGIFYVSSADLDGDFIVDYLYAGDLRGNVWRFDLTSSTPANWAVSKFGQPSATPLFEAKDSSGNLQPITTSIAVTATMTGGAQRVILGFGTGRAIPFTNAAATTYQPGTQSVYGIWDWNLSAWNAISSTQFAVLPEVTTSPYRTFSRTNLFTNTLATQDTTTRTTPTATVCWNGSRSCTSGNTQYGWKFDLPDSGEQVIYNPVFTGGLLLLNTIIPTTSTCIIKLPEGWTMGFDMASGGGLPQNVFAASNGSFVVTSGAGLTGLKQGAVGTPYIVSIGSKPYAISSNVTGGAPLINELNTQAGVTIKRISWEQLR